MDVTTIQALAPVAAGVVVVSVLASIALLVAYPALHAMGLAPVAST